MTGYTKLSSGILSSSIWSEDDRTRIVWITLLAMADKHGEIMASIPGVARMAGVPIADAERAIQRFQQPDPYSRTSDKEGRRLEAIDGGWVLVNHEKYRAMFSKEDSKTKAALRQQRHRDKSQPPVTERDTPLRVTPCHDLDAESNAPKGENNASVTHGRDIADTEAKAVKTPLPPEGAGDAPKQDTKPKRQRRIIETTPAFESFWSAYPNRVAKSNALKAWTKIQPDETLANRITDDVRRRATSDAWTKDQGQFIPHPATYLNQRRWEDEIPLPAKTSKTWSDAELLAWATR